MSAVIALLEAIPMPLRALAGFTGAAGFTWLGFACTRDFAKAPVSRCRAMQDRARRKAAA